MTQTISTITSGHVAITISPQADGHHIAEAACALGEQIAVTSELHGQSMKHAVSMVLEQLARKFRQEAEAEQNLAWDAVDRLPSGAVKEKRFHVILHYERVTEDESKFEAMLNTQLGNTVVENAEISAIQLDPSLPIEPLGR